MSQPTASFQLSDGRYKVNIGTSFLPSKHDLLYTAQIQNAQLDARSKARRALMKKVKGDNYVVEWNSPEGPLKTGPSYEAQATPHEDVGVLIFDENTKRFTLERPLMHLSMTLKRKSKNQTSLSLPASIESSPAPTLASATSTSSAASVASEPTSARRKSIDDFEKDLEKDMLEVLGSDSESEEETITTTTNNKRKATPEQQVPKRRKIQMASQPIRPLDLPPSNNSTPPAKSGTLPALPSRPIRTPSPRSTMGGKAIANLERAKRASVSSKSEEDSTSSSSYESSSGSESSGSESESDSDSSSDDMEDLEESINSTLDSSNNHVPSRPIPLPPTASNSVRPMSLRELYADENIEDEGVSSSSDED